MFLPLFLSTIAIVVSIGAIIFNVYKAVKLSEASHQEIEDTLGQLIEATTLLAVMIFFAAGARGFTEIFTGLVSISNIAKLIVDTSLHVSVITFFIVGESAVLCGFYSLYQSEFYPLYRNRERFQIPDSLM